MATSGAGSGEEITHCEWCGAEYPAAGPRDDEPRRAAPPPVAAATGAVEGTRCEWCGAEYPVPGEDA